MEQVSPEPGTLVDLLDRALDRGVIVNADIVISLAGVPLIGLQLRAALAGIETMVRYGMMAGWDARTHAGALEPPQAPLDPVGVDGGRDGTDDLGVQEVLL